MKFSALTRICVLGLLASTASLRAGEEQCDKNSKIRAKIKYLFELPDAKELLPQSVVRQAGAAILLDETAEVGEGVCIYTTVAQLGDRTAVERFGNAEIFPWFWGRATIKARVRHADGTVYEIRDEDIQCADYEDESLLQFGKNTPRRYIIQYPGLQVGDLIQQQISAPCDPFDYEWEPAFYGSLQGGHQFIDLWEGTGRTFTLLDGYEVSHYPARLVRYTLLNPRGASMSLKFYPEDVPHEKRDFAGIDRSKLTRIALARPMLPQEPYDPPFGRRSPMLAVTLTGKSFANSDWDDWVNVEANRITTNRAAAAKIEELIPVPRDPRGALHAIVRFFRDDSRADDPRYGNLLPVLKARGFKVAHVRARSNSSRPIDRTLATMHWFNRTLVMVELPEGRVFVTPDYRIAVGALPADLQGAEAIIIHDRKTWEWTRLPVSGAADNRVEAHVEITGVEGPLLRGRLRVRYSGAAARPLRWMNSMSDQSRTQSALHRLTGGMRHPGVSLGNVRISGLDDADLPVELSADFEGTGLIRQLGSKRQVPALFWYTGPEANEFAASTRSSFIDMGPATAHVNEVRLPAGAMLPELPAPSGSAQGVSRIWELTGGDDARVIRRTLEVGGEHPAESHRPLREQLGKIELADQWMITLPAEPAP